MCFPWLCKFASEARKKDGEPYHPKAIHHYIMGIQRHIRQTTKSSVNLLTNPEFLQLQNLLDALYRKLHTAGIGTTIKEGSLPAVFQVTDATVPYHDDLTGINLVELFDF